MIDNKQRILADLTKWPKALQTVHHKENPKYGLISSTTSITTPAVTIIGIILLAPVLAAAAATTSYLTIDNATISFKNHNKTMSAILQTEGSITTSGSGGAFGYGILTSDGNTITAVTTHPGVLDSALQESPNDATFHTHFVQLKSSSTTACAPNDAMRGARLEVRKLTKEAPDSVSIKGPTVLVKDIPATFKGTNALDGSSMFVTRGNDVTNVVSFTLHPILSSSGKLQHVCVEDISHANTIRVLS